MEQQKVEEGKIDGFDRRSIIRDPRTGKVIKEQHYTVHVSKIYGEFMMRDGKCYAPNGVEIQDPRLARPEAPAEVEAKPAEVIKEVSEPAKEKAVAVEKKPEVSFTKKN